MPVLVVARLGAYGDGDHASGWDPDSVQAGWADQAREAARQAGRLPAVPRVQLVIFTEGRCVQAMHRGPAPATPDAGVDGGVHGPARPGSRRAAPRAVPVRRARDG